MKIIDHATNHSVSKLFDSDIDNQLLYNPKHGWEWHMLVIMFCYLYGRYISYVIIYLRLKQMLNGSIFAYKSQTYKKVLLLLICNGLSLVALIVSSRVYTGQTQLLFIFVFVWIVTDMLYFVILTYMHLSNLRKIKNTYHKFIISMQSIEMSAVMSANETNNNAPKMVDENVKTSNNNVKFSGLNDEQLANKKQSYQVLSKIVTIYTRISITLFVSSFTMFTSSSIFDLLLGIQVIGLNIAMIDCVVNSLCLVLYFQRERTFYNQIKTCNCTNCFKY